MPKKTTPRDDAAQSARFIKTARELGCDESPDAFKAAVKKVARHKPAKEGLEYAHARNRTKGDTHGE